jgi:hypothetical protein
MRTTSHANNTRQKEKQQSSGKANLASQMIFTYYKSSVSFLQQVPDAVYEIFKAWNIQK